MGGSESVAEKSIHDFTVKDSQGKEVDLSIYKGKVVLIVNVASKWDKGLEILAFPCNQFLKQEPATSEQVQEFVCTRFNAEYPVFQKVDVNGKNAAPIYKFLKASKAGGGFMVSAIKWNFTKFLIDKQGQVICRYATTTAPLSIHNDIENALAIKYEYDDATATATASI